MVDRVPEFARRRQRRPGCDRTRGSGIARSRRLCNGPAAEEVPFGGDSRCALGVTAPFPGRRQPLSSFRRGNVVSTRIFVSALIVALSLGSCGGSSSESSIRRPSTTPTTLLPEQAAPRSGPYLQFTSATTGWFADQSVPGQILGTTDGGESWWTSHPGSYSAKNEAGWVESLDFTDSSHGWALLADRGLISTVDGGRRWSRPVEPAQGPITTFMFTNSTDGWATTDHGAVLITADGGHRWHTVTTPVPAITLCASSSGRVWFGDGQGDVYLSAQDGPWKRSLLGSVVPDMRNSVGPSPRRPAPWLACEGASAWALYNYGSAAGSTPFVIERTLNSGGNWSTVLGAEVVPAPTLPPGAGGTLLDFGAPGPSSAWVLDYCGPCITGSPALVTTTNGTTFTTRFLPLPPAVYALPIDVAFSDLDHGWAVLREYPSSQPGLSSEQTTVVLATSDAGATWKVVDPQLTS